jgi:hypothetical protein
VIYWFVRAICGNKYGIIDLLISNIGTLLINMFFKSSYLDSIHLFVLCCNKCIKISWRVIKQKLHNILTCSTVIILFLSNFVLLNINYLCNKNGMFRIIGLKISLTNLYVTTYSSIYKVFVLNVVSLSRYDENNLCDILIRKGNLRKKYGIIDLLISNVGTKLINMSFKSSCLDSIHLFVLCCNKCIKISRRVIKQKLHNILTCSTVIVLFLSNFVLLNINYLCNKNEMFRIIGLKISLTNLYVTTYSSIYKVFVLNVVSLSRYVEKKLSDILIRKGNLRKKYGINDLLISNIGT